MKHGMSISLRRIFLTMLSLHNRGADPRARRLGDSRSGAPRRRAQSGQLPRSGARRRGKVLDEVSAAIPGDPVAGNASHEWF